jgi:decaprenylphospho-beta-D-erythro-pentofuranosid-2-ulose 2-reductase
VDAVLVALGTLGRGGDEQLDEAADVIRTNFVGAVAPTARAVRLLEAQGHGTLIVLSSVAAERPRKSNFVYGSSKAGLDAFAQGLHDALAGTGVHVMVVRPGFVRTKMTAGMDEPPLTVGPEGVAEEIVGGLRRKAVTVWVPPAIRWVMLVLRLLPRPLFRRLPI